MALYTQAPLLVLEPRIYPDESGSAALTNSVAKLQTSGGSMGPNKNDEAIAFTMASYSQAPLLGLEPRTYPDESGSAALTNSGA